MNKKIQILAFCILIFIASLPIQAKKKCKNITIIQTEYITYNSSGDIIRKQKIIEQRTNRPLPVGFRLVLEFKKKLEKALKNKKSIKRMEEFFKNEII